MHKFIVFAAIALLLGGCVGGKQTSAQLPELPADDQVQATQSSLPPVNMDRWGMAAYARGQEEATKRAALAVEKAEAEARTAEAKTTSSNNQKVVIEVDTKEELQSLLQLRTVEALKASNENLAKVAVALADNRGGKRDIPFHYTPVPQGAFAEGMTATGKAGKDLLGAPASIVSATAYGIASGLDASGADQPRTKIEAGDDVKMQDALNNKPAVASAPASQVQQEIGSNKPVEVEGEGASGTGAESLAGGDLDQTTDNTDNSNRDIL